MTKKEKLAFTLAEVLITLGVIGVVAAVTMPTLIKNYKNKEVESKLQKIYTVMNQAITMSEIDNGPKEYWDNMCSANNESYNEDCRQNFEKYFLKYLKYLKFEEEHNAYAPHYSFRIYMNDGSLLWGRFANTNNLDFYFFPNAANYKTDFRTGSDAFAFRFSPSCSTPSCKYHYKKGFEPYAHAVNKYTKEELTETGAANFTCNKISLYNNYCTALIYLNGWKIPKDFPDMIK